jgi:hypothetical protein
VGFSPWTRGPAVHRPERCSASLRVGRVAFIASKRGRKELLDEAPGWFAATGIGAMGHIEPGYYLRFEGRAVGIRWTVGRVVLGRIRRIRPRVSQSVRMRVFLILSGAALAARLGPQAPGTRSMYKGDEAMRSNGRCSIFERAVEVRLSPATSGTCLRLANRGSGCLIGGRRAPSPRPSSGRSARWNHGSRQHRQNGPPYYEPEGCGAAEPELGLVSVVRAMGKRARSRRWSSLAGIPVIDAPADLDFAGGDGGRSLKRLRLGHTVDETSAKAEWHIPRAHYLESWSDACAAAGPARRASSSR